MATLTHLASRYRWELMLVLVIPFVSGVIGLLLIVPLIALDALLDASTLALGLLSIVQPILLAIFYFHVRALGRSMLTLAWAYVLVFAVSSMIVDLFFSVMIDEVVQLFVVWSFWRTGVELLVSIIVLVWFARLASRFSFNHALLLIALSTALNGSGILIPFVPFPTLDGWIFAWETAILNAVLKLFALWVLTRLHSVDDSDVTAAKRSAPRDVSFFGGTVKFLMSRVLPRFDPDRGRYKEVIIALLSLSCLLRVGSKFGPWIGEGPELTDVFAFSAIQLLWWAVETALIIGLAYAVRVRQPPERPSATVLTEHP